MAINPNVLFPTKTAAPTVQYPYGAARNVTAPGDGTGTPWVAAILNDLFGFQQALLDQADLVPTGNPDEVGASQYLDALKAVILATVSVGATAELSNAPNLIAHRGFGQVNIQNTLPAMRSAKLSGADSVEFDVQTSADGTPYLFHDTTVDSLTNGTGVFTALTDAQVDALEYTQAIGTPLEGLGVPTLAEVIHTLSSQAGDFYPEIKAGDLVPMVNEVKDAGLSGRVVWQSFNLQNLVDALAIDPSARYGYLVDANNEGMRDAVDAVQALDGAFFLLAENSRVLANPSIVSYAKYSGVDIGVWTVNVKDDYEALLNIGVFNIMSDRNLK